MMLRRRTATMAVAVAALALVAAVSGHGHGHGHGHDSHESVHTCIHDKVAEEAQEHHVVDAQVYDYVPPTPDMLARMSERDVESRRQNGWANIRVTVDYSYVTVTGALRSFIVDRLVPAAERWIEESLRVRPVSGALRLSSGSCYDNIRITQTSYSNTDLVIYVGTKSTSGSTLAYATSCRSDSKGRAIAGMINFGPSRLEVNGDFERQVSTAVHELAHVLGFSSYAFPRFIDPVTERRLPQSSIISGSTIIAPLVRDAAREHFGCADLEGIDTENNGGSGSAGSHWEKRIVLNEYMSAVISTKNVYSALTFKLFEASGWYLPDYSKAEPFFWGKGEGCDFVRGSCRNWDEPFGCTSGSRGCSYDGFYSSYCQADTWADNCAYMRPYSNGDCRDQGADYRCFEANNRASCFPHQCTAGGELEVYSGRSWLRCPVNGGTVSGVTCPPAEFLCASAGGGGGGGGPSCPNDCSGRGTCQADDTCRCQLGWIGADCSQREQPKACPDNCNGNGACDGSTGTCQCEAGFTGFSCALPDCPGTPDCSSRGRCVVSGGRPTCACDDGYTGAACSETTLGECSGNGQLEQFLWFPPYCVCDEGFTGDLCETALAPPPPATCPNDCSGHGSCDQGTCRCSTGWVGSDCSERENRCEANCNAPNGQCVGNECVCDQIWSGAACAEPRCPYHPSCGTSDPDPPTDDPSGSALTGTVSKGEYFTAYIDIPVDGVLTVDLKIDGDVQSVLLLRRGEAPTIDVFDARTQTAWYDFTSEQRIQEFVTPATWYISVHNPNWFFASSSFSFELVVSFMQQSSLVDRLVESPCPGPAGAACNDNGLCAQRPDGASFCECNEGFAGDECNFVVDELVTGETLEGSADVGQWVLFRYPVTAVGVLRVSLDKGRFENARPLLFARMGAFPTLETYDEVDFPGYVRSNKQQQITINFGEELDIGDTLYIGVYNSELYASEAMDFFLSVSFVEDYSDGCAENADCNGRGTCVEGVCECMPFYRGAQCSTPFAPQPSIDMLSADVLERGLPRLAAKESTSGTIDGQLYSFFAFEASAGKELVVTISSDSGDHQLYGSKAAFPRTFYDLIYTGDGSGTMVIPAAKDTTAYTVAVLAAEAGEYEVTADEREPGASDDEFPLWSIGVVAGGVALVAGVAGVVVKRRRDGEAYNRQTDAGNATSPRTMM